jgi:hypothetical protein
MAEPKPTYQTTNGTVSNADLQAASDYAELAQARRAIIQAGAVIERLMDIPPEKRQILLRERGGRPFDNET